MKLRTGAGQERSDSEDQTNALGSEKNSRDTNEWHLQLKRCMPRGGFVNQDSVRVNLQRERECLRLAAVKAWTAVTVTQFGKASPWNRCKF